MSSDEDSDSLSYVSDGSENYTFLDGKVSDGSKNDTLLDEVIEYAEGVVLRNEIENAKLASLCNDLANKKTYTSSEIGARVERLKVATEGFLKAFVKSGLTMKVEGQVVTQTLLQILLLDSEVLSAQLDLYAAVSACTESKLPMCKVVYADSVSAGAHVRGFNYEVVTRALLNCTHGEMQDMVISDLGKDVFRGMVANGKLNNAMLERNPVLQQKIQQIAPMLLAEMET